MEQITREEMIGLLLKLQALAAEEKQPESSSLEWPGMTLHDYFAAEARTDLARYTARAIAALQAAEPVAWIGEEELDGLAMHRRNDFPAGAMVLAIKAGSAVVPLFTLPCPPATELAPESWREELETIAEILEADGDEWHCAARIRKILKTSPAKAQVPEGWDISFYSPCRCHRYERKWSGRAPRDRDSPEIIQRILMPTGGQWVCKHCGRHEPKQRKQQ